MAAAASAVVRGSQVAVLSGLRRRLREADEREADPIEEVADV